MDAATSFHCDHPHYKQDHKLSFYNYYQKMRHHWELSVLPTPNIGDRCSPSVIAMRCEGESKHCHEPRISQTECTGGESQSGAVRDTVAVKLISPNAALWLDGPAFWLNLTRRIHLFSGHVNFWRHFRPCVPLVASQIPCPRVTSFGGIAIVHNVSYT